MEELEAKILIAEDERLIALDLKNILKSSGYSSVFIEHSGEGVINFIKNIKPNLILMDIMMDKGMSGIEAVRLINKLYNIPVIYITASTDTGTLNEALETNPADILIKPFSNSQLKKAVKRALEN